METVMGVPNAIDDKPENANNVYTSPKAEKNGKSRMRKKRRLFVTNKTTKSVTTLKQSRKSSCSRLDMPVSFNTVEKTSMKLNPNAATITQT